MDLKSKCNHYCWESLDVSKSSYSEAFKSWLAPADVLSSVTSSCTTGDFNVGLVSVICIFFLFRILSTQLVEYLVYANTTQLIPA